MKCQKLFSDFKIDRICFASAHVFTYLLILYLKFYFEINFKTSVIYLKLLMLFFFNTIFKKNFKQMFPLHTPWKYQKSSSFYFCLSEISKFCFHCVKSIFIRSFSGPYFPTFPPNTEGYSVSLRIQSECGKIRTTKTPNTDTSTKMSITLNLLLHVIL